MIKKRTTDRKNTEQFAYKSRLIKTERTSEREKESESESKRAKIGHNQ